MLELETRIELVENHSIFAAMGFKKIGETAHDGYQNATSVTMQNRLLTEQISLDQRNIS